MYSVKIEYIPIEPKEDGNLVDERLYQQRINAPVPYSVPTNASLKTSFQPIVVDPYLKILRSIDHNIPINEHGDLLVFLPGLNEISSISDKLKEYAGFSR